MPSGGGGGAKPAAAGKAAAADVPEEPAKVDEPADPGMGNLFGDDDEDY